MKMLNLREIAEIVRDKYNPKSVLQPYYFNQPLSRTSPLTNILDVSRFYVLEATLVPYPMEILYFPLVSSYVQVNAIDYSPMSRTSSGEPSQCVLLATNSSSTPNSGLFMGTFFQTITHESSQNDSVRYAGYSFSL